MFYRVHQFIQAIFTHLKPWEIAWALDNLPPEAHSLFLEQSRPEQRHALDLAQSLKQEKNLLTRSDFQTLLVAALLHDCGKSMVITPLWHRVFIVLMQKMPRALWSLIEGSPSIFSVPLKTASHHATWGSNLAQKAGLNPVICLLIQEHHSPTTELGRILKKADNAH